MIHLCRSTLGGIEREAQAVSMGFVGPYEFIGADGVVGASDKKGAEMKIRHVLAAALVGVLWVPASWAGDLKSGIAVGGKISSYKATKCGGIDDGVKTGKTLCYT